MTLVFRCFGAPAYCELHAKGESTEQDGPPDEGGDREEDIDSKGRAEGSGQAAPLPPRSLRRSW
jgi:hypothetical protein